MRNAFFPRDHPTTSIARGKPAARRGNSPNTADPLPVIMAGEAPARSNRFFRAAKLPDAARKPPSSKSFAAGAGSTYIPHLRLETKYFILLRFACQTGAQRGDRPRRWKHARRGPPEGRWRRAVGQRKQLRAAADSHRRARPAERTARRCRAARASSARAGQCRALRPASTGSASSTAAASDDPPPSPAPMGMRLVEPHLHAPGGAHGIQRQRAPRAPPGCREWPGRPASSIAVRRAGREGDLEGVRQRDGLEDGAQLVVAVGPLAQHAQIEIDLGQRAHARPASARGAHLSYWSSEKTS